MRLISDVPVGTFCSGGVDSSLVTAVAARIKGEGVNTFSIGFPESDFDESAYALMVSKHAKTNHHQLMVGNVEYAELFDLSTLGGIAVKGLFLNEREGHPAPRVVETPAGMLNAIGLQGIGVRRFVEEKLPELVADDSRTMYSGRTMRPPKAAASP